MRELRIIIEVSEKDYQLILMSIARDTDPKSSFELRNKLMKESVALYFCFEELRYYLSNPRLMTTDHHDHEFMKISLKELVGAVNHYQSKIEKLTDLTKEIGNYLDFDVI